MIDGRRVRRIGVNLLWLVPGVVGGSEEYTTRLLRAFAECSGRHPDLDVRLFVNRSFGAAHGDLVQHFPTEIAPVDGSNKALRVLAETTWLARATRRQQLDVVHHAGGTMPPLRTCPGVVTIHDLQPLEMPGHFGLAKRTYVRLSIPPSVRAARRVVTLTRWTQQEIISRLGVRPDRMVLISPGTEPPGPEPSASRTDEVLGRYDLAGRRFFVYPAITYPHKNHVMLVGAFAELVESHPDAVLVLTGGPGPCDEEVRSASARAGTSARVRRPGRIPAADLDVLYRRAAALTFPSLYEGCGMPVLEAMMRGCPVLAANATALPEVVGGAGPLIDPDDPAAWSAAMRGALDDAAWRDGLVDAGRRRAAQFEWVTAVKALEDLYRLDDR